MHQLVSFRAFFFFNDTATTEIYTLSLHDALPISAACRWSISRNTPSVRSTMRPPSLRSAPRSEEHTSELQSPDHLVCRLLLEKKKKKQNPLMQKMDITRSKVVQSTYRTTQHTALK